MTRLEVWLGGHRTRLADDGRHTLHRGAPRTPPNRAHPYRAGRGRGYPRWWDRAPRRGRSTRKRASRLRAGETLRTVTLHVPVDQTERPLVEGQDLKPEVTEDYFVGVEAEELPDNLDGEDLPPHPKASAGDRVP